VARVLIESKIDLDAKDNIGETALHRAAARDKYVFVLGECGARYVGCVSTNAPLLLTAHSLSSFSLMPARMWR
jgi:hypothetical protein